MFSRIKTFAQYKSPWCFEANPSNDVLTPYIIFSKFDSRRPLMSSIIHILALIYSEMKLFHEDILTFSYFGSLVWLNKAVKILAANVL